MSEIPGFDKAADSVSEAKEQSRRLIPWLPDPKTCDHCGSLCEADHQYVEEQCIPMDVWQCPNEDCNARYYRDEDESLFHG